MDVLIKKTVAFFQTSPLHVLMLPFFFIINVYNNFSRLIDTYTTVKSFLLIFLFLSIFYLILYRIYKDKAKAGFLSTFIGILFLYFGNIKNSLSQVPLIGFLSRHTFFLPLLFLILVLIFYQLRKKTVNSKVTLLLNTLLLIYIGLEAFKWMTYTHKEAERSLPAAYITPASLRPGAIKTKLPDIIYVVLDCYPSPSFQEEMLGKKDHYLDSSLKKMGFFSIPEPRSNYNGTAFTLSSVFQLEYHSWLHNNIKSNSFHYNKAMWLVKNAALFNILSQFKYQMHNFSIFDFADKPAVKKVTFLSMPTQHIIFYNTLIATIQREILWNFNPQLNKNEEKKISRNKELLSFTKDYNQQVADSLLYFPGKSNDSVPSFVYAHLLMPHFPYFFDSTGKAYPDEEIYGNMMIKDKIKFRNYISYTDKKIAAIIQSLIQKNGANSIIIIQSDHGVYDFDKSREQDAFRNYSAFYFPDGDYSQLYAGMSNVNTFRIVLNKYFDQQLPLLKDSSVYIRQ
jgi:hypothetical protein